MKIFEYDLSLINNRHIIKFMNDCY